MTQTAEQLRQHLVYKYAHVGCPAARYEDNCDRPGECADNGRCLDLPPMKDADDGQPSEMQEWHDYDRDC